MKSSLFLFAMWIGLCMSLNCMKRVKYRHICFEICLMKNWVVITHSSAGEGDDQLQYQSGLRGSHAHRALVAVCVLEVCGKVWWVSKFQRPKPETDPDHTVNKSCLTKAAFLSLFFSAYTKPHNRLPPHLCGQGVWFTTDPKLLLLPSHTVSSGINCSYANRLAWCVSRF